MYNCKYKNIRMKISWYLEVPKYLIMNECIKERQEMFIEIVGIIP